MQVQAIKNLEMSFAQANSRALVQMATGSGKTFTAVNVAYRLLKHANAGRILFLVDRGNLGRQTEDEFANFEPPDDARRFPTLYTVQRLQTNAINPAAKVVVTTIQRLYSMLKGDAEFDSGNEEGSSFDSARAWQADPPEVVYNPAIPPEFFDFIIVDECHRSIYELWSQVLLSFDAFLVGLTATPAGKTVGFFNQNLVMQYAHAEAVTDGVNVDFDVYRMRVPSSFLEAIQIPLPPSGEQERIVEKLDELLSDLEAGIAALLRVKAKLALYRASILKAAVAGALTGEWREKHPHVEPASELLARILVERRRRWEEEQLRQFDATGKAPPKNWKSKYKEPADPNPSKLPSLPRGWCWATLDQLTEIAGGVTKGQRLALSQKTRMVPYLRVANVQQGFLNLAEIKQIRALESDITSLKLAAGDVLFNEGGDRDKLGRGWVWEAQIPECIHQNHVFRARPILRDIQPKILSWCGNSYGREWFMKAGKQSVNLASINLTVLRSFPVAVAPAEEQSAIVETAEDQLSVIDHVEADINAKILSAQSLRHAILRDAFLGKLVSQDPNHEPASELLKRIGEQREAQAREVVASGRRRSYRRRCSAAKDGATMKR